MTGGQKTGVAVAAIAALWWWSRNGSLIPLATVQLIDPVTGKPLPSTPAAGTVLGPPAPTNYGPAVPVTSGGPSTPGANAAGYSGSVYDVNGNLLYYFNANNNTLVDPSTYAIAGRYDQSSGAVYDNNGMQWGYFNYTGNAIMDPNTGAIVAYYYVAS